jgi:DNA-binding FadR family transcriptional regulator
MTTTRPQRVVAGLKDKILSGELAPGAKLPSEAELLAEYAVSRTVVREAVSRLQAEGLVETFQGRGSFVLAVPEPSSFTLESSTIRSHHDVLDMVDFRLGVESEAAALAAARITPASAEAIEAAMAGFTKAGAEGAVEADFAFHRAVAAATGNRFYVDLLDSLGPMMIMLPRTRLGDAYSMTDATHVERVQREHDNVAAAVLAGDVDTARAAMRVHLGNTRRRLQP